MCCIRYLLFDNTFLWDFDKYSGGVGQSASPPAGSSLTVQYTVDYARSSDVVLTGDCGVVTLNPNPNPSIYKLLLPGVYDIEFGIDSCASDLVSVPGANITDSPCKFLVYILDETGLMVRCCRRCVARVESYCVLSIFSLSFFSAFFTCVCFQLSIRIDRDRRRPDRR